MSLEPQDVSDKDMNVEPVQREAPKPGLFRKTALGIGISVAVLAIAALGIVTSVYTIPSGHKGVISRFGNMTGTAAPGLHAMLPFWIDGIMVVDTDRIETETFGYRVSKPGLKGDIRKDQASSKEASMITADLGIIEVRWVIQYKRNDPVMFLKNLHDPVQTVRDMGESAMRRVVGDSSVDDVFGNSGAVAKKCRETLQRDLDRYGSGILVVDVKVRDIAPPDAAREAFNEVSRSRQEKDRIINDALAAYNQEIPRARGEAEGLLSKAQGYALERVNTAHGEASRFKDILREYRRAKEVTRKRLYLETCREVIPKARRIIIVDSRHKGLVPSIDLDGSSFHDGGKK